MKAKRFLALALCIAMVMGNASMVSAAEIEPMQTEDSVVEVESDVLAEDEISDISSEVVEDNIVEVESEEEITIEEETITEEEKVIETNQTEEVFDVEEDILVEESLEESFDDSDVEIEDLVITDFLTVDASGNLKLVDASKPVTLSTVEIPASISGNDLKHVPADVFQGNTNIKEIIFNTPAPSSSDDAKKSTLETIAAGAFKGCSSLTTVTLPTAYRSGITEAQKISEFADYTFYESGLTTIYTGDCKIKKVGNYAFSHTNIRSLDNLPIIEEIGTNAFENCAQLITADMPHVEKIGARAFEGCQSLGKNEGTNGLTVSSALTEIGDNAFKGTGLLTLNIKNSATGLGIIDHTDSTTIATSKAKLGNGIFENCTSLKKVTLPDNMEFIPTGMFKNCYNLSEIYFGKGLTEIGTEAFRIYDDSANVSKLTSVVIPDKVINIGTKSFYGCNNLTTVEIQTMDRNLFIASDAFPKKGTALKIKGKIDVTKFFATEQGYAYEDIGQTNEITFEGFENVYSVSTSPSKPKFGETVFLSIKPIKDYTLFEDEGQFVKASIDNSPIVFEPEYVSYSADGIIRFKFIMPYVAEGKKLNLSGVVEEAKVFHAEDEKVLKYRLYDESKCDVDEVNNKFTFTESGVKSQIKIKDKAGRLLGPWRFTFSAPNVPENVVQITKEGLVISGTNTTAAGTIYATLISTGKTDSIAVKVTESVIIQDISIKTIADKKPVQVKEWPDKVTISEMKLDYKGKISGQVNSYYNYIELKKSSVYRESLEIPVEALLKKVAGDPTNYIINTEWISEDSTIAKVGMAKSVDATNTIIIPKGATGITEIRVKVTNNTVPEGDPSGLRTVESSIIVNVIDNIPRLISSTMNINSNSSDGIELPVAIVDNYNPDAYKMWISNKVTVNKVTDYQKIIDLEIKYDSTEGKYYIGASDGLKSRLSKSGAKQAYKNVYLCGNFDGEEFEIPVSAINVTNSPLKPSISMSGKINLFYNPAIDTDRRYVGKVVLKQSLTNIEVEGYAFLTADHYKEYSKGTSLDYIYGRTCNNGYGDFIGDEFNNNFTYTPIDDKKSSIDISWRNSFPGGKDKNGNDVTSGYVLIEYKGYDNPVACKITIPTCKTAPAYVLDVASATTNVLKEHDAYEFYLVDKSTKRLPTETDIVAGENVIRYIDPLYYNNTLADISFDKKQNATTRGLFKEPLTSSDIVTRSVEDYPKADNPKEKETSPRDIRKIQIETADAAFSGKAVVNVQCAHWLYPIKYTFSLKAVKNVAKVKGDVGTMTLNKSADASQTSGLIKLTLDQTNAFFDNFNNYGSAGNALLTYKANAKNIDSYVALASKIAVAIDGADSKKATISADISSAISSIAPGTYQFTVKPYVYYNNPGEANSTNTFSFKVVVTDKQPELALKTNKFAINGKYPLYEIAKSTYSIKNMPGNVKYVIDTSGATLTIPAKTKDKGLHSANYIKECVQLGFEIPTIAEYPDESWKFNVKVIPTSGTAFRDNFSYNYEVSGVKIYPEGDSSKAVAVKPFTVNVSGKITEPTVSQKATGTINPIDPKSTTAFVATVKGINRKVTNIKLVEYDTYNRGNEITDPDQQRFEVVKVPVDDAEALSQKYYNIKYDKKTKKGSENQFVLIMNTRSGAPKINSKIKTYTIRFEYELEGMPAGKTFASSDINITPKQVIPGMNGDILQPENADNKKKSLTMYSCSKKTHESLIRVVPKNGNWARNNSPADENTIKIDTSLGTNAVALTEKTSANIKRAFKIDYYEIVPTNNSTPYTYNVYKNGELMVGPSAEASSIISEENKFRRTYTDEYKYQNDTRHYYVKITLLNPTAVPMNKALDLNVEFKYVNQIEETVGSVFKTTVTVRK